MGRKVASTAPLRNSAVKEKSFHRKFSTLQYLFNNAASDQTKAEKIKLWNRFIPLTPTKATKILGRDLPDDTVISLRIEDDSTGEIEFYAIDKFNDDGSFDLDNETLDAGLIRVQDGYKGQGIGRTVFRNQIEFFYACGVRKFEVNAALDNGGYTWARVGFLPDDLEEMREDVAIPAKETINVLGSLLKGDEKKLLKKHLKFKKRENLWHVADADIDIGPRLKDTFNRASGDAKTLRQRNKAKELVKSLKDHFSAELFSYMKERATNDQPVMIGRLLLTGTSWSGSIDMDNAKQMKKVGAYTGGWRYLEIK